MLLRMGSGSVSCCPLLTAFAEVVLWLWCGLGATCDLSWFVDEAGATGVIVLATLLSALVFDEDCLSIAEDAFRDKDAAFVIGGADAVGCFFSSTE